MLPKCSETKPNQLLASYLHAVMTDEGFLVQMQKHFPYLVMRSKDL